VNVDKCVGYDYSAVDVLVAERCGTAIAAHELIVGVDTLHIVHKA